MSECPTGSQAYLLCFSAKWEAAPSTVAATHSLGSLFLARAILCHLATLQRTPHHGSAW